MKLKYIERCLIRVCHSMESNFLAGMHVEESSYDQSYFPLYHFSTSFYHHFDIVLICFASYFLLMVNINRMICSIERRGRFHDNKVEKQEYIRYWSQHSRQMYIQNTLLPVYRKVLEFSQCPLKFQPLSLLTM